MIDPICGMKVDSETALKFNWQGRDYFFCSENCREIFIKRLTLPTRKQFPMWKNKIFLMLVLYLSIFVLASVFSLLEPLRVALIMYLKRITFPIILGLFIGGVIDWLVPEEYVSKLLAQKRKITLVYAVLTGFLMSACSHGILALTIQLYKKGASVPAVIAFLLASPWANLPLTILMFGFFGVKAFFIVGSAIVIAFTSGYIFMWLESLSLVEHNPNTITVGEGFSIVKDATERIKRIKVGCSAFLNGIRSVWNGSVALANMVLWWIMLGAFLASLAAAYLPVNFMKQYLGPSLLGLVITLVIATILEICSEGTAPLAFEIYRQTGALGNSLVFLMAGVVTDYTEIGLLWTNIGWRTALWLPVVAAPQAIMFGVLANLIFR